jgi:hypothetical protein
MDANLSHCPLSTKQPELMSISLIATCQPSSQNGCQTLYLHPVNLAARMVYSCQLIYGLLLQTLYGLWFRAANSLWFVAANSLWLIAANSLWFPLAANSLWFTIDAISSWFTKAASYTVPTLYGL